MCLSSTCGHGHAPLQAACPPPVHDLAADSLQRSRWQCATLTYDLAAPASNLSSVACRSSRTPPSARPGTGTPFLVRTRSPARRHTVRHGAAFCRWQAQAQVGGVPESRKSAIRTFISRSRISWRSEPQTEQSCPSPLTGHIPPVYGLPAVAARLQLSPLT